MCELYGWESVSMNKRRKVEPIQKSEMTKEEKERRWKMRNRFKYIKEEQGLKMELLNETI